eukprot:m.102824 g.102824  ORF g.102824 m.102824 type:complete len:129 (+) comp12601_c0_seq4:196-582(+)
MLTESSSSNCGIFLNRWVLCCLCNCQQRIDSVYVNLVYDLLIANSQSRVKEQTNNQHTHTHELTSFSKNKKLKHKHALPATLSFEDLVKGSKAENVCAATAHTCFRDASTALRIFAKHLNTFDCTSWC